MKAIVLFLLALLAARVEADPEAVVDDLGRQVLLTAPPQRIISLAPSITELLFALGQGQRLVGVTQYCDYPAAAAAIDKVAGFSDLNLEKIALARPDLIVASRGNDAEALESLRQLGVPIFALANNSVEEVIASLRRLGRLIDAADRGNALADSLRDRVRRVAAGVAPGPRPTVLWGIVGDPIYTAGAGSIIDDVIRVAGGDNVGARAGTGWPQVSLESIVDWAPQVFLTSVEADAGQAIDAAIADELATMRSLDGWRSVPAVRTGRLVHIDADLLSRPGPRLIDTVEILAHALAEPGSAAGSAGDAGPH